MKQQVVQLRSFHFRTILAACFAALALVCAFVIRGDWMGATRERPAPSDESQLTRDTARGGQLGSSNLDDPSRVSDLALSIALPGRTTSDKNHKDLQVLAAQLLDASNSLKVRRQAAWNLAKLGSAEALAVLRKGLINAPAQLQGTIAEALGNIDSAESREMLRSLLKSDNEIVIRGAIRGWATLGDNEALQLLSEMLLDSQKGDELRTEAALSLSKINSPRAYQILANSLNQLADRGIAESILTGLGHRSFAESERFFRSFLSREDVPAELRAAALESLGHADGNPAPLLLQHLQSKDSSLRAASAWALSTLENAPDVASQLIKQLDVEGSADVRTRIYQALENQSNLTSEKLPALVLNDPSVSSRVAGLKLWAAHASRQNSLTAEFDAIAVPQLESLAINGPDFQNRMISVMALKQARTPGAVQALDRIVAQSAEPRIVATAK